MEFNGKVHVRDLERGAFETQATEADSWVQDTLAKAAPDEKLVEMTPETWAKNSTFNVNLRLEKISGEYLLNATGEALVPSVCARTGEPFKAKREFNMQTVIVPTVIKEGEEEDYSDDPDYVFLHTETIDLTELLSQQLIVLEPIAEYGPNAGSAVEGVESGAPLEDVENSKNNPFSALAALKDQLKK